MCVAQRDCKHCQTKTAAFNLQHMHRRHHTCPTTRHSHAADLGKGRDSLQRRLAIGICKQASCHCSGGGAAIVQARIALHWRDEGQRGTVGCLAKGCRQGLRGACYCRPAAEDPNADAWRSPNSCTVASRSSPQPTEMASAEMRCSRAARCCILRPVEAAVMAATTVGPLYVRASSVAGVMPPEAAMKSGEVGWEPASEAAAILAEPWRWWCEVRLSSRIGLCCHEVSAAAGALWE